MSEGQEEKPSPSYWAGSGEGGIFRFTSEEISLQGTVEGDLYRDSVLQEIARKNDPETTRDAAYSYLQDCGLDPTPDAVGQLTEVFLPCLRIMCERGYDPKGSTWRKAGRLAVLADVRKKFERLWERAWIKGKRHDDSALDLINYTAFYLRADRDRWGEWGEPGIPDDAA
jgi:hypothetical protein